MRFLIPVGALAAGLCLTIGTASADVIFDVNAALQYGGTLTGTVTTNNAFTSVTSFDLVASAGPGSRGYTFPGFTYTPADSSVTAETSTLIQFDSTPAGEELRLTFSAPLNASGATLTSSGYESEIVAGSRTTTSGSLTPAPASATAPEPASFGLFAAALLPAALLYKRRRALDRLANLLR